MTYNFSYIIDTLTCAAYQMPEKMTIYSTLVGWLNSQDDHFGLEFIKYILEQLNDMLLTCRWEAARYMTRFISGTERYISDIINIGLFLFVLNWKIKFKFRRKFIFGIKSIGEIDSSNSAICVNLNSRGFDIVCPICSSGKI